MTTTATLITTPELAAKALELAARTQAAMEGLDRPAWEALLPELTAHNAEHLEHLRSLVVAGELVDVAVACPRALESRAELHLLLTRRAWEACTVDEDGQAEGFSLLYKIRHLIAEFQAGKNPEDLTRRRFSFFKVGGRVPLLSEALLLTSHASIVIGLESEAL